MARAATASPLRGRPYVSLRGRAEFARVYRVGRRRKVGGVLVVSLREGSGPPRVGIVVGRRVGEAVVRNRVKRRLREALARAELGEGTAYIVVALPGMASASFEEIQSWIRRGTRPDRTEAEEDE